MKRLKRKLQQTITPSKKQKLSSMLLPTEVWIHTFTFLPIETLLFSIALTNKQLYSITKNNTLWEILTHRDFIEKRKRKLNENDPNVKKKDYLQVYKDQAKIIDYVLTCTSVNCSAGMISFAPVVDNKFKSHEDDILKMGKPGKYSVYVYTSKDGELQWAAITQESFQFPKDQKPFIEHIGYVDTPTGNVQCCDTRTRHFFAKGCNPKVRSDTQLSGMGEVLKNEKPVEYTLRLWGGHDKFEQFLNDLETKAKELGLKVTRSEESNTFGPTQDSNLMEKFEYFLYKLEARYRKHVAKDFGCGCNVDNSHCVYDLARDCCLGEYPCVGGTAVVISTTNGGYPVVVYTRDHELKEKQTVQCAKALYLGWEIDKKSITQEEIEVLKQAGELVDEEGNEVGDDESEGDELEDDELEGDELEGDDKQEDE